MLFGLKLKINVIILTTSKVTASDIRRLPREEDRKPEHMDISILAYPAPSNLMTF